jgi:hypothetical protein
MTRPTYRAAIAFIALNDNSGNGDSIAEIAEYTTTNLVADVWGKDPKSVARSVARVRKAEGLEVQRSGAEAWRKCR